MRKTVPVLIALAALNACDRAVEWPAAAAADVAGACYAVRVVGGEGRVVRVTTAGAEELGVGCDAGGAVALAADGKTLYYGRDGVLYAYELKTAVESVVAAFPAGEAREMPPADDGPERVLQWRCGYRFRDIVFYPAGAVAFRVEENVTPLPAAKAEDFTAAEKREFKPRSAFAAETGVYFWDRTTPPRYLGPSYRVFGFADDATLLIEYKMTLGRLNVATNAVDVALPAGAHELGFLPVAAVAGGKAYAVAAKADKDTDDVVVNSVYAVGAGATRAKAAVAVPSRYAVSRAVLSGDGKYLAFEAAPRTLGEPVIYAVDLERAVARELVVGGRLVAFAPGGRAVYCVRGSGPAGDLYLVGLDGGERRLTASGDILPLP